LKKNQIKHVIIPSNEVINETQNFLLNDRNPKKTMVKIENYNNLKLNKHDDSQHNKIEPKSTPKSFILYYITRKNVTHSSEVSKVNNVKVDAKNNNEMKTQRIPSYSNGQALDRTKNDSININENKSQKKIIEKGARTCEF
jgi:hypothetical protein